MLQRTPNTTYLKDYTPPDYLIDTVDLRFELGEAVTRVMATLSLRRNEQAGGGDRPLVLHGQDLVLRSLALDGQALGETDYRVDAETLTIPAPPAQFTLAVETELKPQENTSLEGLYKSSGNFCTQCEAEGFRKITYFLDRPDVMARYTTTLVADQSRYPMLLSNGNPVARGELDDGRHWVTWEDPFPKPSYLFALVAGDLVRIEDRFVTRSGRDVALHIYVQKNNVDKCDHAMASLKRAMQWDEETYGREYDLDLYMIVAVDDFNMGAMENKGLNVFNSAYVLAKPETATDNDYVGIEGVIAHEYFHNWSGNRVTCRDWFQLSLKEGFTVFRDQSFTADVTLGAVKRINDVRVLRTAQFPEDGGPMAHPVRPDSYIEISNFYTATVYRKGAEVVRMIRNLLGTEGFRRGTDLYFDRHDGQAVTTDDFVRAMEDANGADLSQFKRWYTQAGTPVLHADGYYEPAERRYTLTLRQSCPPTPGQPHKEPFHIPVAMGLLDRQGNPLQLQLAGESSPSPDLTRVLQLHEAEQRFTFIDIDAEPLPSLLRGFSAPVKLDMACSDEDLAFLFAHDTDPFNRWEAGQQLAVRIILRLVDAYQQGQPLHLPPLLVEAVTKTLENDDLPDVLVAAALSLPAEAYLAEQMAVVDPLAIHEARRYVRTALARELRGSFLAVYERLSSDEPYRFDAPSLGRRSLKNLALGYLMELDDPAIRGRSLAQFNHADNMADVLAALDTLANTDCAEREEALAAFYQRWRDDALVVDKWFSIQATSRLPDTLTRVHTLIEHPAFSLKNPNKVRALIGAFCQGNPVRFHEADGRGYAFLAEQVLKLNALNPQVAARMLTPLTRWQRYDPSRQVLMKAQLERIAETPRLSKDVYEIVSKSLA